MKKIFALGWMLVAALALTNCSKEETVTPEVEGQAFELFASTNGTRTTMADLKTSWKDGDAMNVWTATATEGVYQSHGQFTVSDVENGKFTGTLDASFDNTTANDWYVIYPYSSYGLMPKNSAEAGTWMYVGHGTPKQKGNNSQAHLSGSSAPLYGVAKAVAGSETPVFQMHHLSTFVRVRVTNNTANPFSVASVYLTSESELPLAGSYYLDITGDEVDYKDSQVKTEVTLTVNNGEEIAVGEQAEFYLPLAPIQFGEADEMLTVDITTTEGATISVEKTIPAGTKFAAGVMNTLKVEATEDNTEYPVVETETWTLLTDPDEMVDGQYIVVAKYDNSLISYLPSTTTSSAPVFSTAPEAFDLTSRTIEYAAIDAMVWNFAHIAENRWNITNSEGAYFYSTAANNGLRVGNTSQAWAIDTHADNAAAFVFQSTTTNRFVGIYNAADWRCYDTYNANNYKGSSQLYLYYKGIVVAKTALATPVVEATADDTTITATWAAVENAASYTVTCCALTGGAAMTQTVSETTCTFTELKTATEYEVSVIANPAENDANYKSSEAGVATATTTGEAGFTTIAEIRETGAGTYNIQNATVIAKGAKSSIIEDETGRLFVYNDLGLAEGDVVTLTNATISTYGDGLQVGAATVEKVGTATINRGEPHVVLGSEMANYTKSYTPCEYIEIEATLSISGTYLNFSMEGYTKTGSYISPSFDLTEWNGVPAIVTAYACYNNNSGYFYILPVSMRVADHISIAPASLSWGAAEVDAKTVTVTSNDDNWSIDETTVPDWATIEATNATTLTVTPTANEGAARYATVVIKHATNSAKVAELILSQDAAGVTSYVAEYILTNDGFANQQDISTVTEENGNADLTVTFAKGTGSNTPKYYTSGNAVRIYSNNTLTIAGQEGIKIQQVKFLYASGYNGEGYTDVSEGSITISGTDGTWICEGGSTVTLTRTGSSGNTRFQQIKVTYTK
ncbi:MAG: fibronectin type III domain-containing protein [Alistipes sp.]|nr:fibronectin type III domain-containing protein [Alistipes sp.]MBR3772906.1 fibronectin type III domain-containing protein [Alistipes sp.]